MLDQLFGVGALAHRGLFPLTGGLCVDLSPHRTTMTQTKCCPILHFWSWWGVQRARHVRRVSGGLVSKNCKLTHLTGSDVGLEFQGGRSHQRNQVVIHVDMPQPGGYVTTGLSMERVKNSSFPAVPLVQGF